MRFGVFELDLVSGELRRKGIRIRLQEQPFRVLALLVSRPGELVTREELRAALWPDAVFVDFDHGLYKAVAKIRRALRDLADNSHYVETLERRGYRFIASVEPIGAPDAAMRTTRAGLHRLVWGAQSIMLTAGRHLIGRDPSATVWLDSSVVSRRHATIIVADPEASISDNGSRNGTFVNGRQIDKPTPLADGDEIRVGEARFTFRSSPASVSTKTAHRTTPATARRR